MVVISSQVIYVFQSTHLLRGATLYRRAPLPGDSISIHAPLTRCDMRPAERWGCRKIFQSTHLLRGSTAPSPKMRSNTSFQSTHLLRGATPFGDIHTFSHKISIHAPLTRCDSKNTQKYNSYFFIIIYLLHFRDTPLIFLMRSAQLKSFLKK